MGAAARKVPGSPHAHAWEGVGRWLEQEPGNIGCVSKHSVLEWAASLAMPALSHMCSAHDPPVPLSIHRPPLAPSMQGEGSTACSCCQAAVPSKRPATSGSSRFRRAVWGAPLLSPSPWSQICPAMAAMEGASALQPSLCVSNLAP